MLIQSLRATAHPVALIFAAAITIGVAGCGGESTSMSENSSSAFAEIKNAVWSDTPIEGDIVSPTDVKDFETPGPQNVMLAGRIDAGELEVFDQSNATFILSQLPDESHGNGDPDHADNCPFCQRKLKNAPKAIVRITDDQGNPLPIAADDLLGLKKDDVVVVSGEAYFDKTLNMVMVKANKIAKR
ncbi:hypothetical protein N9N28_11280 [Rubripirellula amarantea]|nr:hypothetical protein [Rubripirellula amarantea]